METRAEFVVDWDGTCVEEVWPGMGEWLPLAREALHTLSAMGKVVVYSLRCHRYEEDDRTLRHPLDVAKEIQAIRDMLDEAGLHAVKVYPNDRGKPPGKYYIDDRAIRFEGDWHKVLSKIAVDRAEARWRECATQTEANALADRVRLYVSPGSEEVEDAGVVRRFESGATRDADDGKLDYEGFLSPLVLRLFAEYMHENRVQSNGSLRASDNWQKGIPLDSYMKSMFRHFMEVWTLHRGGASGAEMKKALMAVLFNVQGYAHELEKVGDSADVRQIV